MKKTFLLLITSIWCFANVAAQEPADTSKWTTGGVFTANFTNTGFGTYWQGGGIPSIAITGLLNVYADMNAEKYKWQNSLDLAYGALKQGERDFIKADDRIDFNTKLGYKLSEKLLMSAMLNFRTQFDVGFEFPEGQFEPDGTPVRNYISQTFAPAYINLGLGFDYQPNKDFSLYFAPVSGKGTIVTDTSLTTRYLPEEFIGKKARFELGSFLKLKYRRVLTENVTLETKADFFSNYIDNFGNVDVNWETLINFKVNKYISASFFTHLIYDDDIRFEVENPATGMPFATKRPRTQFKHVLSIGLTYAFGAKK